MCTLCICVHAKRKKQYTSEGENLQLLRPVCVYWRNIHRIITRVVTAVSNDLHHGSESVTVMVRWSVDRDGTVVDKNGGLTENEKRINLKQRYICLRIDLR